MFCYPGDEAHIPEEKRTMFRIPVRNYGKFEREVAKLSKRSQKAGGWQIDLYQFGVMEDEDGIKSYEVFLDAPEVRLDGHTFVARLDHSNDTGNVIRMLPNTGIDLPLMYREVAPKCDHCQINRLRRDTFVLRNDDTGAFVQLGSSCMSEFFKTDPRAIAKLAEIVGYAREVAEAAQRDGYTIGEKAPRSLKNLKHVPMEDYLLYCAAAIRIDGRYKPAIYSTESTRRVALQALYAGDDPSNIEVTSEDERTVEEALSWVELLADRRDRGETLNQYEHNVLVVGQALVIEGRSTGLAASIVGCYKRNLQPPAPIVVEPKPEPKKLVLSDMGAILALFQQAGSNLRYPKITISFPDVGEIVLSMGGSGSQYPGSINVCSTGGYGNNTWYGRIHRDGRFEANRRLPLADALEAALNAFAADPTGVAAEYGRRSGNCCFCHKKLTDQRSAVVGYGKICATKWARPYPTAKEAKLAMATKSARIV